MKTANNLSLKMHIHLICIISNFMKCYDASDLIKNRIYDDPSDLLFDEYSKQLYLKIKFALSSYNMLPPNQNSSLDQLENVLLRAEEYNLQKGIKHLKQIFNMNKTVKLNIIDGDATAPIGSGLKIICHVCNDIGAWGKGFVMAVEAKWPIVSEKYKQWHRNGHHDYSHDENVKCTESQFKLGAVQFVKVTDDIWVANMIAQHGIQSPYNTVPLKYDALTTCLNAVATFTLDHRASVHMPKIGARLAGGNWDEICKIIEKSLIEKNIKTTVYLK